jgi:hypothetical protein
MEDKTKSSDVVNEIVVDILVAMKDVVMGNEVLTILSLVLFMGWTKRAKLIQLLNDLDVVRQSFSNVFLFLNKSYLRKVVETNKLIDSEIHNLKRECKANRSAVFSLSNGVKKGRVKLTMLNESPDQEGIPYYDIFDNFVLNDSATISALSKVLSKGYFRLQAGDGDNSIKLDNMLDTVCMKSIVMLNIAPFKKEHYIATIGFTEVIDDKQAKEIYEVFSKSYKNVLTSYIPYL